MKAKFLLLVGLLSALVPFRAQAAEVHLFESLGLLSGKPAAAPYIKRIEELNPVVPVSGVQFTGSKPIGPTESLLVLVPADKQELLPPNMAATDCFSVKYLVGQTDKRLVLIYNAGSWKTWGGPLTAIQAMQHAYVLTALEKEKAPGLQSPTDDPAYVTLTLDLFRSLTGAAFDAEAKRLKTGGAYNSTELDKALGVTNATQRSYVQHWLEVAAKTNP